MNLPDVSHWANPRNWPWVFWIWIAFAAIGSAPKIWQWARRKTAEGWPTISARIDSATVSQARWPASQSFVAGLNYSYSVTGQSYVGRFERRFATEQEAQEFVRDLQGKSTFVRYHPDRANQSMLPPHDLQTLLNTRIPVADASAITLPRRNTLPPWSLPFLGVFLALAGVGFILSLWVHIGAVFGAKVAPDYFFVLLHVGIFVVFFPAILVAQRLVGNTRRSDFWKVALRDVPPWLRYVVYASFGYAIFNFVLFATKTPAGGSGANPPAEVWRGFSGHWMAFYSAAFALLYAGAVASRTQRPA
jgi:hypothetical protein